MEEFIFNITQPASTYYTGNISISAKDEKSAIKKLKKLSQKQLNDLVDDWELGDDVDADGNIEVYDSNGKKII